MGKDGKLSTRIARRADTLIKVWPIFRESLKADGWKTNFLQVRVHREELHQLRELLKKAEQVFSTELRDRSQRPEWFKTTAYHALEAAHTATSTVIHVLSTVQPTCAFWTSFGLALTKATTKAYTAACLLADYEKT